MPEDVRPRPGVESEALLYDDPGQRFTARLRELSDAADVTTRTFAARFVLEGAAAQAPIGATVTIYLPRRIRAAEVKIPIAAAFDFGKGPEVWLFNKDTSTIAFQPIAETGIGDETITVTGGLQVGQTIVAMGSNLLHQGEKVEIAPDQGAAP